MYKRQKEGCAKEGCAKEGCAKDVSKDVRRKDVRRMPGELRSLGAATFFIFLILRLMGQNKA